MMKIAAGGGPAGDGDRRPLRRRAPGGIRRMVRALHGARPPGDRFETASGLVEALAAALGVTIARPSPRVVGYLAELAERPSPSELSDSDDQEPATSRLPELVAASPEKRTSLEAAMLSKPHATALLPSSEPELPSRRSPAPSTRGRSPPRSAAGGAPRSRWWRWPQWPAASARRRTSMRPSAARAPLADAPPVAASPSPVETVPPGPPAATPELPPAGSAPRAATASDAGAPQPAGSVSTTPRAPLPGPAPGPIKRSPPVAVPSIAAPARPPQPAVPDESVLLRRQ